MNKTQKNKINEEDLDYLAEYHDKEEHFFYLANIPSYMWINSQGNSVDLRRCNNLVYLKNIRDWMLKNSCYGNSNTYTEYTKTKQFLYVDKRIKKLEYEDELAKNWLDNLLD